MPGSIWKNTALVVTLLSIGPALAGAAPPVPPQTALTCPAVSSAGRRNLDEAIKSPPRGRSRRGKKEIRRCDS